MKRGRKAGKMPERYLTEHEEKIVFALELSGGMTFNTLQRETKMSSATLSACLKKLSKRGYVERAKDPRIYRLTRLALDPSEKVLSELATLPLPYPRVDPRLVKGLVTDTVIEEMERAATLAWDAQAGEFKFKQERWMPFCQFVFIKALARFYVEHVEVHYVEWGQYLDEAWTYLFPLKSESAWNKFFNERHNKPRFIKKSEARMDFRLFEGFCHANEENERVFPILVPVKKKGILDNLERLSRWITPLVEIGGPEEDRPPFVWRITSMRSLPALFLAERNYYFYSEFLPAWRHALLSQRASTI